MFFSDSPNTGTTFSLELTVRHIIQNETLHILVTRHPYEWLESMRRNAFYSGFHKGLEMDKFLTLEWMSLDIEPATQLRSALNV
jgi:hypothetical protein